MFDILDILKDKEFWIVSCCQSIILLIVLSVNAHFFPNKFEEKGRKKLCQLKQYEYCNNEELEKELKELIKSIKKEELLKTIK